MTRNLIIIAINMLIALLIAASAIIALLGGCDFAGSCSGSSNMLTWALAAGLPVLVMGIGGALIYQNWRGGSVEDGQTITIVGARSSAGELVSDYDEAAEEDAAAIEDVTQSRLARLARQAHDDARQDARASDEAAQQMQQEAGAIADVGALAPPTASAEHAPVDPDKTMFMPEVAMPGLSRYLSGEVGAEGDMPRPDNGSRPALIAHVDEWPEDDAGSDPVRPAWFDWLVLPQDHGSDRIAIASETGFPWTPAGIDIASAAIARRSILLSGGSITGEATAWQQVVADMPRAFPLGVDDAAAFAGWFNNAMAEIGYDCGTLVEHIIDELLDEAAGDTALAAQLPAHLSENGDSAADEQPRARFG